MTTASREQKTNQRNLTAITLEHIYRSFKLSENMSLKEYLELPLETLLKKAKNQAVSLLPYFKIPAKK